MFLHLPKFIFKLISASFALWIFLSTVVPQVTLKFTDPEIQHNKFVRQTYPYNSLTSPTLLPIKNSTVYFIIGHPDDEVMFFLPSLVEVTKSKHSNNVKIICFSRGDAVDESLGDIRSQELRSSARIIGINDENVIVLDKYKDGMEEQWSAEDISSSLATEVADDGKPLVLITFDDRGVSNHPNHISLFHGTRKYVETHLRQSHAQKYKLYVLKSLNFWEKYSFTLLTDVELFVDLLSKFVFNNLLKINVNISFFNAYSEKKLPSIKFYSDLNMISVSYAAMAYGHFSQMVWFRYGWLIFSRYLTFNHLIQIN